MPTIEPQFIIPFAKPSGMTSFTSLWQVKRALGTKKVGHTGTLDRFADGLLVLLSGKLTKLVPYIKEPLSWKSRCQPIPTLLRQSSS